MSRRRSRRRGGRFGEEEELNPMNYVSNLSDVMLVLAVGIMVALILHWNVPIQTQEDTSKDDSSNQQNYTTFTDDELDSQDEVPENMERKGEVYYDQETGTYYILENQEGGTE